MSLVYRIRGRWRDLKDFFSAPSNVKEKRKSEAHCPVDPGLFMAESRITSFFYSFLGTQHFSLLTRRPPEGKVCTNRPNLRSQIPRGWGSQPGPAITLPLMRWSTQCEQPRRQLSPLPEELDFYSNETQLFDVRVTGPGAEEALLAHRVPGCLIVPVHRSLGLPTGRRSLLILLLFLECFIQALSKVGL